MPALVTGCPSTTHLAGQDQRARALARRREAALDDELIEADAWHRLVRLKSDSTFDRSTIHRPMPSEPRIGDRRPRRAGCSARSRHSCAIRRDASTPYIAGYVGLPAAASLPAVLPRSAEAPSTSRMSSTIWNARPNSPAASSIARDLRVAAAAHDGAGVAGGADQRAGLLARASSAAPSRIERRRERGPCGSGVDAGEIDRLAADHAAGPAAAATISITPQLARDDDRIGRCAARAPAGANASVSSPSPARIAMPSPATTCSVGRPRRIVSLSIAGRSS